MTRRRWKWILIPLALGVLIAGFAFLQRHSAKPPDRWAGFPTTQFSSTRDGGAFVPLGKAPFIITSPDTYYTLGGQRQFDSRLGGLLMGGKSVFGGRNYAPAIGNVGQGEGLLFIPVADGSIEVFDELSRATIRVIVPPRPIKDAAWLHGKVLAYDPDHFYAFDPVTGNLLWTHSSTGGLLGNRFKAGKDCFYIGEQAKLAATKYSKLKAISPTSGETIWEAPLPYPLSGAPALAGNTLYCACMERIPKFQSALIALDASSGRKKWESADFSAFALKSSEINRDTMVLEPSAAEGIVCVSMRTALCGMDAQSGKLLWTWPRLLSNGEVAPKSLTIGPPLIRGGHVFVGVSKGVFAFDLQTGRQAWQAENYPDQYLDDNLPDLGAPPIIAGNFLATLYRNQTIQTTRLPMPALQPAQPIVKPLNFSAMMTLVVALVIGVVAAAWIRRFRMLISAIALILCALASLAWLASYQSEHFLGRKMFAALGRLHSETTTGITSHQGSLTFGRKQTIRETSIKPIILGDPSCPFWYTRAGPTVLANGVCVEEPSSDLNLFRFAWTRRSRASGTSLGEQAETSLTVPHWVVIALLAILPLAWLGGYWRDRRRYPAGRCTSCGYDLRASSGRCPECGAVDALAAPAALGKPSR